MNKGNSLGLITYPVKEVTEDLMQWLQGALKSFKDQNREFGLVVVDKDQLKRANCKCVPRGRDRFQVQLSVSSSVTNMFYHS
jgi:hypothetical protein